MLSGNDGVRGCAETNSSHHSSDSERDIPLGSLNTSLGANRIPVSKLNDEMSCIDNVAKGCFGVVKRGVLDMDNHWYAIKQTKKDISGEGDLQQRLQEVYALSACDHPNIVRYFDSWVEDKAVFMRTELVPHDSVRDLSCPLEERLVQAVVHQISSALHQLHSHGMIHRDVKPDNILARRIEDDADGNIQLTFKLCDFGLVRPIDGQSSSTTGENYKGINDDDGDRNYLCPEAFAACDALHVGAKADIYALGASCVELMGGDPAEVRNGRYTFDTAKYSSPLVELVKRMTAQHPAERPSAFDVTLATLDAEIRGRQKVQMRLQRIRELRSEIDATKESACTSAKKQLKSV